MNGKDAAAVAAVARIQPGMAVGLGSGSTVDAVIRALAERAAAGLRVRLAVASSRSEAACHQAGLQIEPPDAFDGFDLVIDGADELDPALDAIKGGGAALVREKLLILAAREWLVVGDASKRVAVLGAFPLPVAVVPYAARHTLRRLERFCPRVTLRFGTGGPLVTDDGLWIADLALGAIPEPVALERELKAISGVVEVGLFVGLASGALLGHPDGRVEELRPAPVSR